jgi:hypothetical protein
MHKFWSKVDIREKHECWEWRGAINTYGYGNLHVKGKNGPARAHRIAYHLAAPAESIEGRVIRHRCDNRKCCNPHHLKPGTHSDNAMDAVHRGRAGGFQTKGEANGQAKLTEAQVRAIRSDTRMQKDIAAEYGISKALMSGIINRKYWKHIK